ncbi:MAG TPA: hypothetical protein VKA46_39185 [Gemmataceae bacterium]|nr:hypothetical protein [Gemmataceae bacterium]
MKRPNRPAIVLVMAILQIIFGSLGLLGNLCTGGIQLAGGSKAFAVQGGPQQPAAPDVEAMMKAKVPHYELMLYGGLVLGLISGTVMIVSGAGLIRMRPWARRLTIGYAFYNIASVILGVVYYFLVTRDLLKDLFAQMKADPNLPPQSKAVVDMTETITSLTPFLQLIFLVYPIALLVILFLPDVRAAFRGAKLGSAEERPEDDDFEDDFDDESDGPGEEGIRPDER